MKIVVCIKAVPETDTRIKIGSNGRSIDTTDVKFIMSPYDEFALEEGLRIKESKGGEVIVIGLGGEEVPAILRDGLARGAESAIHINSDGVATDDSLIVGKILTAVMKEINPEIVLFGKHGVGGDNQQVPSVVAEYLGFQQITVVTKLEISDKKVRAEREIEGGIEVVETSLPVVISAQKGLNEPRYPKLPAIMQAKKKPFSVKSILDLGFSPAEVSEQAAATVIAELKLPPSRQAGQRIEGNTDEQVRGLLDALQKEAKVI